jgi:hypothetical protein
MGPELPTEAIDQARDTLTALGSPDVASTFAKYRWPKRTVSGAYHYQAAAQEIVTCKNEKKFANFHYGEFTEVGDLWPNEISERLEEVLKQKWELTHLTEKCKGSLELEVSLIAEPLPSSQDTKEWLGRYKAAFKENAGEAKVGTDVLHETFRLEAN